jgi:hypothetical protein
MTIHFDITLDDILAFNQYVTDQSPVMKRYYWIIFIGIPILVLQRAMSF